MEEGNFGIEERNKMLGRPQTTIVPLLPVQVVPKRLQQTNGVTIPTQATMISRED